MKLSHLIACVVASLAIWGGAGTVVGVALYTAQEDDKAWNCHLRGDKHCGSDSAWHGFVNLF